jgi:hypothetical protein
MRIYTHGEYYCGFSVSYSAWNILNQWRFFSPGRDRLIDPEVPEDLVKDDVEDDVVCFTSMTGTRCSNIIQFLVFLFHFCVA